MRNHVLVFYTSKKSLNICVRRGAGHARQGWYCKLWRRSWGGCAAKGAPAHCALPDAAALLECVALCVALAQGETLCVTVSERVRVPEGVPLPHLLAVGETVGVRWALGEAVVQRVREGLPLLLLQRLGESVALAQRLEVGLTEVELEGRARVGEVVALALGHGEGRGLAVAQAEREGEGEEVPEARAERVAVVEGGGVR